jgi:hypothetical protein
MYRSNPVPSTVVDALEKQDAYRKHLSAVSNAKSVIDTSAPPVNRRLELWRVRFARDHEGRQIIEDQSKSVSPVKSPLMPGQYAEDIRTHDPSPRAPKSAKTLLGLATSPKVVQPRNGPRKKAAPRSADILNALELQIHFDPRGQPQIAVLPEPAPPQNRRTVTFSTLPTLPAPISEQHDPIDDSVLLRDVQSDGDEENDEKQPSGPAAELEGCSTDAPPEEADAGDVFQPPDVSEVAHDAVELELPDAFA